MASFTPYQPNTSVVEDVNNWRHYVSAGVDMTVIGFDSVEKGVQIEKLFHNAHETTVVLNISFINSVTPVTFMSR